MKTPVTRSASLVVLAVGFAFAVTGCQLGETEPSRVAGHSGPSAPSGPLVTGGSGPSHDPATNPSHVGPTGAGPAGSQ